MDYKKYMCITDVSILNSNLIRCGELVELIEIRSEKMLNKVSVVEIRLIGAEKTIELKIDAFILGFTLIG